MDVGNILHFLRGESGAKPTVPESGETGRDFSSLLQILRGVLPPRRSDAVAEAGAPPSPAPFQAVADRSTGFSAAALTKGEDSAGLGQAVTSLAAAPLVKVEDTAVVPDEAPALTMEAEFVETVLKDENAPNPEAVEADVQVLASASLPAAPAASEVAASTSAAPAPVDEVDHDAPHLSNESAESAETPALRQMKIVAERASTPAPARASVALSAQSEAPAAPSASVRRDAVDGEASNANPKDTPAPKSQLSNTGNQTAAPDGATPVVVEGDARPVETSSPAKEPASKSTSTPTTSASAQSVNDGRPQETATRPVLQAVEVDPAESTSSRPGAARQSDTHPVQARAAAPGPGTVDNAAAEDQVPAQENEARAAVKTVDHAAARHSASARQSTVTPEKPTADKSAPAITPKHQPEIDASESRSAGRPVEDGADATTRVHRNVWAYAASRRAAAPRPDVITDTRGLIDSAVRESLGTAAQSLETGHTSTTLAHDAASGTQSATSPAESPRQTISPQINKADQPLQTVQFGVESAAPVPARSAAGMASANDQAVQESAQTVLPATESNQAPITPVIEPSPEPHHRAAPVAVENAVDTPNGIQAEQKSQPEVVPETAVEPESDSRGDGNASGRNATGDGPQQNDRQRGSNTASADARAARPGSSATTGGVAPSSFEVDGKTLRQEHRAESPTVETARTPVASVESDLNSGQSLSPRIATSANEAASVAPLDPTLDGQSFDTMSPEELRLADATADRPARTDTPGAAAPRTFSAASSARASLAWLDAVMQRPAAFHTEANGTQVLRLELEDDDGTVTLRARRDGERMLVNVTFTDPTMQASAESQGDDIRSALQQLFESGIDLSFSQNEDAKQNLREAHNRTTGPRGREAVMAADDVSSTSRTRTIAAGARHEWVG